MPTILKDYCLHSIGHKEISHRHRLTKNYCDLYESSEEILKNIPPIKTNEIVWREFVLSRSIVEFHVSKKSPYLYNQVTFNV